MAVSKERAGLVSRSKRVIESPTILRCFSGNRNAGQRNKGNKIRYSLMYIWMVYLLYMVRRRIYSVFAEKSARMLLWRAQYNNNIIIIASGRLVFRRPFLFLR